MGRDGRDISSGRARSRDNSRGREVPDRRDRANDRRDADSQLKENSRRGGYRSRTRSPAGRNTRGAERADRRDAAFDERSGGNGNGNKYSRSPRRQHIEYERQRDDGRRRRD